LNGKSYIGFTSHPGARKSAHRGCTDNCVAFNKAIRKYGFNSFKYEVLLGGISNMTEAKKHERLYIKRYCSYGVQGYNLTEGGDSGPGISGENCSYAKLTELEAIEIIKSVACHTGMANMFNVDIGTICKIRNGSTWKHLKYINRPKYEDSRGHTETGNPHSRKLNEEQVMDIIMDCRPHIVIAEEYNISPSTITMIRNGNRWKHLSRVGAPKYKRATRCDRAQTN